MTGVALDHSSTAHGWCITKSLTIFQNDCSWETTKRVAALEEGCIDWEDEPAMARFGGEVGWANVISRRRDEV